MAASCSVKENRLNCPLFLLFNEEVNVNDCKDDVTTYIYEKGSTTVTKTDKVTIGGFSSPEYVIPIQKGATVVTSIAGTFSSYPQEDHIIYPDAQMADSLYALTESFVTTAEMEEYFVQARLGRQVAPVSLSLRHEGTGAYPFIMVIRSQWNGFEMRSLKPVAGDYHYVLQPTVKGGADFLFTVPRQGDSSLTLEFWSSEGKLLTTYPLGELMRRDGYDWTDLHLKKYTVYLDYANSSITIAVRNWRDVIVIENYVI